MIQVKNMQVCLSLMGWLYHSKLQHLIAWIYSRHKKLYFTEGHRIARHLNDLHATNPVRAIDLRSWIFKNPRKVKQDIDDHWIYDSDRPKMSCCVYHRVGIGGWHFHCQVHPNTRMREE